MTTRAELWGALVGIDEAHVCGSQRLVLVGENMGALAQLLWGRASASRPQQQRILRRVTHRLGWAFP